MKQTLFLFSALSMVACHPSGPEHHETFCGDDLCSFSSESGSIKPVSTWHPQDVGVDLELPGTRISRRITIDDACVVLSFLAHVERAGDAVVTVDLDDDGKPEWEGPVPRAEWAPMDLTFVLETPSRGQAYAAIEKRGKGITQFTELNLESTACNSDDGDLP